MAYVYVGLTTLKNFESSRFVHQQCLAIKQSQVDKLNKPPTSPTLEREILRILAIKYHSHFYLYAPFFVKFIYIQFHLSEILVWH